MAHSLPKELRILIVALAAAAVLGGLMAGFSTPRVGATIDPPKESYVKPCVSFVSGEVTHGATACPAGSYAVDLIESNYGVLCANVFNKKFYYRYGSVCGNMEKKLQTDGSMEIWGCYNRWTGALTSIPTQASACAGTAMPFELYFDPCGRFSAPVAADRFGAAPLC